jgi:aconitate hydratase 2/2-methylisocitrate dehydratase
LYYQRRFEDFISNAKNIDEQYGKVEFKASVSSNCQPTNIVDELKAEGDWEVLQNTLDSNLMIMLKGVARTGYENILYLERPGCNLCMVTKKKQPKEIR